MAISCDGSLLRDGQIWESGDEIWTWDVSFVSAELLLGIASQCRGVSAEDELGSEEKKA